MIITCPGCSTKFIVRTGAIGINGRRVRCTKCTNSWFQLPEEEAETSFSYESIEITPIPKGSNLPAITRRYATPLYIKLAFISAIILLLFALTIAYSNKMRPYIGWYYDAIGVYDDIGLSLQNISVQKDSTDDHRSLLLTARIVNESETDKIIPNLRVQMLDRNYKKINIKTFDFKNAILTPGSDMSFEDVAENIPDGVEIVIIDIGNPLNLAAR
jgi:predicted Zn finger-like uncharacterized protein